MRTKEVIKVIKACPFCNGDKHHVGYNVHQFTSRTWHYVVCDNCGAEGPIAGTRFEAIELWNTREEIGK